MKQILQYMNLIIVLNWIKLEEIDPVKIGMTYLLTGERIQNKFDENFMLY